jgi:hypothetical protein
LASDKHLAVEEKRGGPTGNMGHVTGGRPLPAWLDLRGLRDPDRFDRPRRPQARPPISMPRSSTAPDAIFAPRQEEIVRCVFASTVVRSRAPGPVEAMRARLTIEATCGYIWP